MVMAPFRHARLPSFTLLCAASFVAKVSYAADAASPKDKDVAEAVKEETRKLQREVQELVGTKQFDKAISLLQQKGTVWLRQYGAKSWPMAEVSSSLADAYMACGSTCDKESAAAELYEKVALVNLEVYGGAAPQYATAVEKAADAFAQIGDHNRALRHYKGLVRKVVVGLGEGHDATKNVRVKLGECAMNAKKYKSAVNAFTKLLDGKLDPENEFHARLSLSVALAKLDRHEVALHHAEAAKELAARQFGETSMHYAKTLNGLAGILERLGRDEEALGMMREASGIVVELLGPNDPTAKEAQQNVEGMQSHIKAKGISLTIV
jgi:tetratricopeptide (TPR) repeat protein